MRLKVASVLGLSIASLLVDAKPLLAESQTQSKNLPKTSALPKKVEAAETAGKKDATVPGLVLKQQFRFVGKSTSYVSRLGIRLQSLSMSMILNSKTRKVSVFSDDTKKYCVYTQDGWVKRSKVLLANNNVIVELTPWKFDRNDKVAGYPCKVFKRNTKQKDLVTNDFLWVTKDIDLPQDARKLIFSLLKLDTSVPDGVPIRHELQKITTLTSQQPNAPKKTRTTIDRDYETFSVVKAQVPESAYVMPVGYKVAGSEMEVFFADEQDMMDEPLDVYKPPATAKPTR